jgi:CRISPR-associated endonuclease Csn1
MYSLEEIKIEELLAYPENFEIDHILPRSISFDDSQSNKVLVKRVENQKKGNKTPYEYLKSGNGKISYDEYKAKIRIMKNIDKKKVEKLLFEGELSKYAGKFIARNLVDTRYATRELMNMFKKFYRDNEIEVKVKSINGSFTSQIRKQWK